jgi:exportin-1
MLKLVCDHAVCVQILESVIKFKWAALPAEQREGIKNYTSNLIIKYSTNEQLYRAESTFISKLNLILVQILKQVRGAQRAGGWLKLLAAADAAMVIGRTSATWRCCLMLMLMLARPLRRLF